MVEAGAVLGAAGLAVALASILYARAQAMAARREAVEASRVAAVEAERAFGAAYWEVQARFLADPGTLAELREGTPKLAALMDQVGGHQRFLLQRQWIENLQDVYFLRKAGALRDHHWRAGVTSIPPVLRMPTCQRVFESLARAGGLEPEFVAWFRAASAGHPPADPAGDAPPMVMA